jgi:hypothetical protein
MPDINTDKVCFVIVKARELECEDEGVEADASNPSDDNFTSIMTEDAYDAVRSEVVAFIEAMDEDEQCELVALAWLGRGDFEAGEWTSAVAEARGRRKGSTADYLLGMPLLASLLEGGLAEFGESCQSFAADRQ